MQAFSKERIQEMLVQDLVANDAVLKILSKFSEVYLDQFAPKRRVWEGSVKKRTPSAAKVTVEDCFAAIRGASK